MRLFVALELSEEIRQALRKMVGELRPTPAEVRWVQPEGMHLTLKFIGEATAEKLPAIQEALTAVTSSAPVMLRFRGLGYFPEARRPRVLWVGIEASPNLAEIAAAVEERLAPLGIPPERRRFVPHLTLGRFKSSRHLKPLQDEVAARAETEFGRVETGEFFLFQSKLLPGGAEYAKLARFDFVRSGVP